MTEEVASAAPLQITPEQRKFVEKILNKTTNTKIAELFRSIGSSGYSAITARIEVVDLVWDALEAARSELKPDENFVVWERYNQPKTFSNKNAKVVPKVFFNNMFYLWMFPMLTINENMMIEEATYELWHTLAKSKDVLALYKPTTIKTARKIISAVKSGDEAILLEYCIDDSDVPNMISKVKEAAGETFASKSGMGKVGRPKIAPLDKSLLQFTQASSKCLALGVELKELTKRLKQISNKPK